MLWDNGFVVCNTAPANPSCSVVVFSNPYSPFEVFFCFEHTNCVLLIKCYPTIGTCENTEKAESMLMKGRGGFHWTTQELLGGVNIWTWYNVGADTVVVFVCKL